jgi:predicted nucleic acid-binding Zn ribbon protein
MEFYRFNKDNASRRPGITTVGEGIKRLLDEYRLRSQFDQTSISAFWEKLVGATIASRTTAIYVKDKVLFLEIESAPLRSELVIAKSKLIQSLNKSYGYEVIEDIHFV